MTRHTAHVTVCICTYHRPNELRRLLTSLFDQQPQGGFSFSVVVADNAPDGRARAVVEGCARRAPFAIQYVEEPRRNIALARNRALDAASGEAVVFIDDDETPAVDWLGQLVSAWRASGVAGVLGPVRSTFDIPPPDWVRKAGFYTRPEHPSGMILSGGQCRTGNVLIDRRILTGDAPAFRAAFGSGGEDVDFFSRMIAAGHCFVWCSQAIVYEHIPPARWARSFLIRRALLRGRDSLRQPRGRATAIARALVAVPAYGLALPWLALGGQHLFMKYAAKLCDHAGRLLALARLNPVHERPM